MAKAPKLGQTMGGIGFIGRQVDPSMKDSSEPFSDSRQLLGLVIIFQAGLNPWLAADVSLSYGSNEFVRNSSVGLISERSNRIHLPILFRIWPWSFISMGLGPYASYRVGSVRGEANVSTNQQTSAHDIGEHGLEAALGFDFPPIYRKISLSLDIRSSFSLTSRPDEARSTHAALIYLKRPF